MFDDFSIQAVFQISRVARSEKMKTSLDRRKRPRRREHRAYNQTQWRGTKPSAAGRSEPYLRDSTAVGRPGRQQLGPIGCIDKHRPFPTLMEKRTVYINCKCDSSTSSPTTYAPTRPAHVPVSIMITPDPVFWLESGANIYFAHPISVYGDARI